MKSIFLLIVLILSFIYVKSIMDSGQVTEEVMPQFVDYNYNHDNLLLYSEEMEECNESLDNQEITNIPILTQKK